MARQCGRCFCTRVCPNPFNHTESGESLWLSKRGACCRSLFADSTPTLSVLFCLQASTDFRVSQDLMRNGHKAILHAARWLTQGKPLSESQQLLGGRQQAAKPRAGAHGAGVGW